MTPNPKKIVDPEFKGWIFYNSTRRGYWIYQSPDNVMAAMVDPVSFEVLFIMNRGTHQPLYTHPNIKKFARTFSIMSKLGTFQPKTF